MPRVDGPHTSPAVRIVRFENSVKRLPKSPAVPADRPADIYEDTGHVFRTEWDAFEMGGVAVNLPTIVDVDVDIEASIAGYARGVDCRRR